MEDTRSINDTETPLSYPPGGSKNGVGKEVEASFEDEVELFQDFLLTSSPMPSLRRVGEDVTDDPPFVGARFRLLDRSASAPVQVDARSFDGKAESGSKGNVERRSLFDAFWKSSMKQKGRFQMPARPASSEGAEPIIFPHNPPTLKSTSLGQAPIDNLLPAVPAPLERLWNRSSGVYPLGEPKPILKREGNDFISKPVTGLMLQRLSLYPSLSEDSSTETTCASTTANRAVHFDPRVVVTEIHDDCPRIWYSDRDLLKFQEETCTLAKAYLQQHPELIPLYRKPIYDPILKKARRKPLFGLQGLCTMEVSPEDLQVKFILLVDPNVKILDLLGRSLQMIFPAAKVLRSYEGASAWDTLKTRDIDIVVCRENLSPRHSAQGEFDSSSSLFSRYYREQAHRWRKTLLISVTTEMEAVGERSIAGHGHTDFVWGLPPPKMDWRLQKKLEEALEKKKKNNEVSDVDASAPTWLE